ncbi:lytic transglycosylase domain-containing protein [Sphingobium chungbukense]|uniref:Lytic transglycosylase n=1 Tax=Sphingobium chungbukense TaxID=56193 RepID=A0A0M3AKS5_9SPHN|nr:lytic transglycosylase domain-containing protein [Sphingobium chungbukense]KKW89551.1 lytic transglycosylase [Sphingobium chungbukense]
MPTMITLLSLALAVSATKDIPRSSQGRSSDAGGVAQPGRGGADPSPWQRAKGRIGVASDPAIVRTISQWRALLRSDALGFSAYAGFIMANPGWPGESRMRRLAESSINPDSYDPDKVIAFFTRFPPRTATGNARLAFALMQEGRMDEARRAAHDAWIGGTLSRGDEAQLLASFGARWTGLDHDRRADVLLWKGDVAGARRMLPYVLSSRRPIYEARIALRQKIADAAAKMHRAQAAGASDAGFVADKATWMRKTGDRIGARQYLANRPALAVRPGDAEKWYELLLAEARAAAKESQWSFAYGIASKLDDAYAPGTDVSDRPIGERDDYTSLAWLAGSTAFYKLNKPRAAMEMFRRYATAAKSPQTRSKGFYWAGRAALQAGKAGDAKRYFARAAVFPRQFYGQLALERLGRPIPAPAPARRQASISSAERSAFASRSVVRAVKALGQMGYWKEQSQFARAIANHAASDAEHHLAAELAQNIGRPDMGVMVGRRALSSGLAGYGKSAFPRVPVPAEARSSWTMVHAIARQESQFDRSIVSHAGARGLMQLMPGTAREQAGKLGLRYNPGSLDDPGYNIRLGASYIERMLSYYRGSYPLAVAAYNAGPGNVNRWLRANGDPRAPGADMLRWIEEIPLYETRNYVQRVLENAVTYDLMNPERAPFRGSDTPLSKYLGKEAKG